MHGKIDLQIVKNKKNYICCQSKKLFVRLNVYTVYNFIKQPLFELTILLVKYPSHCLQYIRLLEIIVNAYVC